MKKKFYVGIITFCAMFLMIQDAVFAKEANVSTSIDRENQTFEVERLLEELLEEGETTYECGFVKADEIAAEFSDNDKIYVLPYLDMQVVSVEIPAGEFQLIPLVTWDISAKYDVVESEVPDALVNPIVIQARMELPLEDGESVDIYVPFIELAWEFEELLKIKHFCQDGKEYYYDAKVDNPEKICFTAPRGLGRFSLMVDGRCVTIRFEDLETESKWDATDIHVSSFPTMEKDGYIFKGWSVEELPGIYTGVLTEELLNQFHVLSFDGSVPILAKAVFEAIPMPEESVDETTEESKDEKTEQEEPEEEAVLESVQEVSVQAVEMTPPATGDSAGVYWYGALLMMAMVGMRKRKKINKN